MALSFAMPAAPAPPSVSPRAFARLREIGAAAQGKVLRVAVAGGGCSGFQYEITLDEPRGDDLVLSGEGESVVVDPVSLPFLTRARIDFSEELIGARFVIDNPNAAASCGCGTSFTV
jgi:iron-sulfur cluster assembly accessory protein